NFVIHPQFDEARPFHDDMAVASAAGKFGYINKSGQWTIKPQYRAAGDFSNAFAPLVTEKGYRYIDKRGAEILVIDCDEALPFVSGIADVRVGQLWGMIDKTEHFVHKPQFARVYRAQGDFIYIENPDGLRGFMNRAGKI